jgi:hypothetical protein
MREEGRVGESLGGSFNRGFVEKRMDMYLCEHVLTFHDRIMRRPSRKHILEIPRDNTRISSSRSTSKFSIPPFPFPLPIFNSL